MFLGLISHLPASTIKPWPDIFFFYQRVKGQWASQALQSTQASSPTGDEGQENLPNGGDVFPHFSKVG